MRKYIPLAVAGVLAVLPLILNGAGVLQLMAFGLLFASLAVTYDLLLGFTGLLSFGHAAYFGSSVYITGIALSAWHWSLLPAALLAVGVVTGFAIVSGAIALRVSGVAFAMVTLALAQGGMVLVSNNPKGLTHGMDGFGVAIEHLPAMFLGVSNTRNLYWLTLALLVLVYGTVYLATTSSPGRVWQALRENEGRVEVLGLNGFLFKLLAFVLAVFLAAVSGVVFVLVQGSVDPTVMSSELTLTLLVMAVLGGLGTRWGAAVGGLLYVVADNKLTTLAGSAAFEQLPSVVRGPLTQPVFLLGVLFICVIMFAPGGLAGAVRLAEMRKR